MLQEISNEILKDLASVYDTQDTFISLYLDVTRGIDWDYISHREGQIISVLKSNKSLLNPFLKNIVNSFVLHLTLLSRYKT